MATATRVKKPKLTFAERIARYPTYDTTNGFGNENEWRQTFAARLGMAKALEIVGEKSPFEMLELDALTSTWIDVRAAYRRLARQFHPDFNPGDKAAEESFKNIQAAYEILEDHPRFKKRT